MVLVDTSVWIDHLHRADARLGELLVRRLALVHPFVLGELACGRLANRATVMAMLRLLPAAPLATNDEALELVERHSLHGRGLGFVDAHLLSSALIGGLVLWTRDRPIRAAAAQLRISTDPDPAITPSDIPH